MKPSYVLMIVAVAALAAVLVWALREPQPEPPPADVVQPEPARPLAPPAKTIVAPPATPRIAGPKGPLVPLDCAHPAGDAARFSNGAVTVAEICAELQALSGPQGKAEPATERVRARHILDRQLDARLVALALAEEHTAVTEGEIDTALAHLPSNKAGVDVAAQLKRQGIDIEVVRRELRRRLEQSLLLALRGQASSAGGDIDREYAEHPERYQQGAGTQVQAYIARTAPNAPAETEDKARLAAEAFALAVQTTPPQALAKAQQLAALPPFAVQPNELEPGLTAALAGLQSGQWTPAVRTRAGWLVAKVVDRTDGTPRPLAEVRGEIVQRLAAEHKHAELLRIFAALRAAAAIEVLVDL